MKKLIAWCNEWWITVASAVLLAFIPLYPKLPLLDIKNTWVYVRVEDFLVLFVIFSWIFLFIRNKLVLKSPLTVPILLFWVVGSIATLHSILLIVPTAWEIFPNVAFLSFLRRIEYMSLFFVAFTASTQKRNFAVMTITLVVTVLLVSLYGVGQKFIGLPAYLTMNEEFAKGVPLTLSALSRVSSTFGGHYDLAAYLVLTLPIVFSLIFGMRQWWLKAVLSGITALGFWVLFMTVSRISLVALIVSFGIVVLMQRRRLVVFLIPLALIGMVGIVRYAPQMLDRFGSTIKQADVLVDAKTGSPIGHVKAVPNTYFSDIVVRQMFYDSIGDVGASASPAAKFIMPYGSLSSEVMLLTEPTAPTGEDLPSGTGYINLTLSPDIKRLGNFLYEPKPQDGRGREAYVINGEYLIKRAYAYDLSFTTRFQGEWPRAIAAFKRNIVIGSGYGSVSLAVDNSYLRMLGEVGGLGFAVFLSIFLMVGISIRRSMPHIPSAAVRSVVLGFGAGIMGLMINAIFIDVFEASKVAFVLWLLSGTVVGVLVQYERAPYDYLLEMRKAATSPAAVTVYLFLAVLLLWSPLTRNYFVGDDFTWFRWASVCGTGADTSVQCTPTLGSLARYFFNSDGFFYRPGTKIYFALMYRMFWLNQTVFHWVSLFFHFLVSVLVFALGRRIFGKRLPAFLSAFLFVTLSGFSEAVFWISASGFLFTTAGMLSALLFYISWREKGNLRYFLGAFLSFVFALQFHELGIVTPVLFLVYELTLADVPLKMREALRNSMYWLLLSPLGVYTLLRVISRSHWLSGDYNFSILKFPLNAVGNAIGYVLITLVGPYGEPVYQTLRTQLRGHMGLSVGVGVVLAILVLGLVSRVGKTIVAADRKILLFAFFFFIAALLPFLGLGNLSPRYGYAASIGVVYIMVWGFSYLYTYLLRSGREIALLSSGVIIGTFMLLHSVGLYQVHKDWYEAGEMVRSFFVTIDSRYHDYWSTSPMEFHFVNVPIRHRDAWVFPVGISDALWFVFRNPDMRIHTWPDVRSALQSVTYGSTTQKVFLFGDDGKVTPVDIPQPKPQ